ncbi:MAG: hypothetical protein NTW19_22500 [Planctomycetota bacterium]|nr:hypothetical protein [Planctomycetota bacterium]
MKRVPWFIRVEVSGKGGSAKLIHAAVPFLGTHQDYNRAFSSDAVHTPFEIPIRVLVDFGGGEDGIYIWSAGALLLHVYPVTEESIVKLLLPSDETLSIQISTHNRG